MNHSYRLVWNDATQRYVPAPETARGRGKSRAARTLVPAAVLLAALLSSPAGAQALPANALPTGGQVVSGKASIGQAASGMTIDQASQKAILHWQAFDIGSGVKVQFNQPNASSIALNRVVAGNASRIDGSLTANGQVWLVNPNGVVFGQGSQVNVGGLVASTLDTTNEDFEAGRQVFTRGAAQGGITNQGNITVADGGTLALLAPSVKNEGTLSARLGNVVLAGGDRVTLEAGADGRLKVAVDPATVDSLIENRQLITADGGQVVMTSGAADALSASVVANTGTVQARTLAEKDGRVLLLADMRHGEVQAAGTLQAAFVETSAASVAINPDLKVHTDGGHWLIDPVDITIDQGKASAIQTALGSGDVTVTTADGGDNGGWNNGVNGAGTDKGDIHVNADISYGSNKLTLNADNNINVNAKISVNGSGTLDLNYGGTAAGTPLKTGSNLNVSGQVDFEKAGGGLLKVNGKEFDILESIERLQGIGASEKLGGNYALGRSINASGYDFSPIGSNDLSSFRGTFDGLGHTIDNLTIYRPNTIFVGLFGYAKDATLRNVGLIGGSVEGLTSVGTLAGVFDASNDGFQQISNVYFTGRVKGRNVNVGGLVGYNYGNIYNAYATGRVEGYENIGGLVGTNRGNISYAYAIAQVTGEKSVGGLVGQNFGYGKNTSISNVYASGEVTGNSNLGGLVGFNSSTSGLFTVNAHWDSGSTKRIESIGYSEGPAYVVATDIGDAGRYQHDGYGSLGSWSPTSSGLWEAKDAQGVTRWIMVEGSTRPFLASEYTNTVRNVHQLQLMAYRPDANYTLGGDIDASATLQDPHSQSGMWGKAGFSPVGTVASPYTGTFDGLGHIISNLEINRLSQSGVGLFGYAKDATLRNVGLVGGIVIGDRIVGALAGSFLGGVLDKGGILNAYSTAGVAAWSDSVGGLVGENDRNISNVYTAGNVAGGWRVGGLVGSNAGDISYAYSTASVFGSHTIGGLVGMNGGDSKAANISDVYASGHVFASESLIDDARATAGGIIGLNRSSGSIANAYWDKDSTGREVAIGNPSGNAGTTVTAIDSAGRYQYGSYGNLGDWTQTSSGIWEARDAQGVAHWIMVEGSTRPFLASEYSTTIRNAHQLQLMAYKPDASYTLANDIDASATRVDAAMSAQHSGMWGAAGFSPVGVSSEQFTGMFDGLGHTITGLTIDRGNQNGVGLFGYAQNATLRNVDLVGGSVRGADQVGALVGSIYATTSSVISNVHAMGQVSEGQYTEMEVVGRSQVGGLAGSNVAIGSGQASISAVRSSALVTGSDSYVGGLVGTNSASDGGAASITDANVSGDVSGGENIGGLVGLNQAGNGGTAAISNAHATGARVEGGGNSVGGLVGYNMVDAGGTASISESSYGDGIVSGRRTIDGVAGELTGSYIGGLVGRNEANNGGTARISESISTAAVEGVDFVGGLVGRNAAFGTLVDTAEASEAVISSDVSASGKVVGNSSVGGLVGSNQASSGGSASISDAKAHGEVSGNQNVGGLVGANQVTNGGTAGILKAHATGARVEGAVGNVGGLAGSNTVSGGGTASISESSYGDGIVSGRRIIDGVAGEVTGSYIGGLVGRNEASNGGTASISASHSKAAVEGVDYAGGLVGSNAALGTLVDTADASKAVISSDVSASGKVVGNRSVGGLVGSNYASDGGSASITDAKAHGDVSGNENVGGLVGTNQVTNGGTAGILRAQANGARVEGEVRNVGGLVGSNTVSGGGTASISASDSTSAVEGDYGVGGLVGSNSATGLLAGTQEASKAEISVVSAIGKVVGSNVVGGLVGSSSAIRGGSASIAEAIASGEVWGDHHVGGLVGVNSGSGGTAAIFQSRATGTKVEGTGDFVGGLVGYNAARNGGTALISGSHAQGMVAGVDNVGGLVGSNSATGKSAGTLEASKAEISSNVSATGKVVGGSHVGGLVGWNDSYDGASVSIVDAQASGEVSGNEHVGGLVGRNMTESGGTARISASRSTGAVEGGDYVGGLVGSNSASGTPAGRDEASVGEAEISGVSATANVVGGSSVGGLVGLNEASNGGTASISNAHAIGAMVQATGNDVGGLVGRNRGSAGTASISDSEATAKVLGANNVGGLAGINEAVNGGTASISESYANGAVSGGRKIDGQYMRSTGTNVGGLIGHNWANGGTASILDSHASGAVEANSVVGGLVGLSRAEKAGIASISGSYASGEVSGGQQAGSQAVQWIGVDIGGLVGSNQASSGSTASISGSHALGTVGGANQYVGGLVGRNQSNAAEVVISDSYAAGAVSGINTAGGLVGMNQAFDKGTARISGSYAKGAVSGGRKIDGQIVQGTGSSVGGLIGYNSTNGGTISISASHAIGAVDGASNVGGLVGWNQAFNGTAEISGIYATGLVSGSDNVGGLVGWNRANNNGNASISGSYVYGGESDGQNTDGPLVRGTGNNVGGLVGYNLGDNRSTASVSGSHVIGAVNGNSSTGGLVGMNQAKNNGTARISSSYANGDVSGGMYVGGLVGWNGVLGSGTASILDSHAQGDTVRGFHSVGGLVGANEASGGTAEISGVSAIGIVEGDSSIGGLVGYNNAYEKGTASIMQAEASGSVSSRGTFVGGLVGLNSADGDGASVLIRRVDALGQVSAGGIVGGLVGDNQAYNGGSIDISHAQASGQVTGAGGFVGGLVGSNEVLGSSTIYISHVRASGPVSGGYYVGGLVGYNGVVGVGEVAISDAEATGAVRGTSQVGGLVGENDAYEGGTARISDAHATGEQVVGTGKDVGGLVGLNWADTGSTASISGSDAAAAVSGGERVGGLVGSNEAHGGTAEISGSHATGTVSGANQVGGLVGANTADKGAAVVLGSHATGSIIGTNDVGGLVGSNEASNGGTASISGSSADGLMVAGTGSNAGGLVGRNKVENGGAASISSSQSNAMVQGASVAGGLVGWNGAVTSGMASVSGSKAIGGVSGTDYVGGLVGVNQAGAGEAEITGSSATGGVDGSQYVGGLVGSNHASTSGQASISGSSASGDVDGASAIGGLAGENRAEGGVARIDDSHASGLVSGAGAFMAGGLVGHNVASGFGEALVSGSQAYGSVGGASYVGGLVGVNEAVDDGVARISSSTARGRMVVGSGDHVGGLVGANHAQNGGKASIVYAWTLGQMVDGEYVGMRVTGHGDVGGLVGQNTATEFGKASISGGEASAHVKATGDNAGGLVGRSSASWFGETSISGAWAKGSVESAGSNIGGLVGTNEGANAGIARISDAEAAEMRAQGLNNVGGLVGWNSASGYGEARISSVHSSANVQGTGVNAGGLVGWNTAGAAGEASISLAYATGQVSGGDAAGGLVGGNLAFGLGTAHISQSFAGGAVQAKGEGAGGLVGFSGSRGGVATISDSYATGQVSGGTSAGGLVGALGSEGGEARIVHAYSTGAVSGGSFVGGLVGSSNGSIESSFYATTDAQGNAINGGAAFNGAGQGKTLSELSQLSTFAGWDIDDQGGTGRTWRIYEGSTAPLLRGFLQQVTVNAQGSIAGKTYDGQIAGGTLGFTSDTPGAVLQGQLGYASSSKNAGSYAMADGTLKFSGLYSHQLGYDVTFASEMNGLSLAIDKAQLRIDGSQVVDKAYDGNTAAQVVAGRLQGLADNESLGVLASGIFDGRNAGTHGVAVTHSLVDGSDGSLASNYVLLTDTRSYQGNIERKALTIDGTQVADKIYDGNAVAQVTAGQLQGLVGNESLGVSASGVFDSKNAGTHGATVAYDLANGSGGGLADNYVLADGNAYQATIERKTLGIDGTQVAGKTYDGNAVAQVTAGQLQGLVGNETLGVSASGVFDSKNAGTQGATVAYDLANGSGGGLADNYVLADPKTYQATIERKTLGIDGTQVAGKTYDGNAVAQVTAGQLQGLVGNETLDVSASGVFDSKNAGTHGATVAYDLANGSGGGLADNYVLADTKAYQATIERKTLGIDGTQVAGKTYDGNAVAQVTVGQLQGLVGNESLSVSASGAFDSKNAGTHSATIAYSVADGSDGNLASNYVLTDTRSYQATIERKTLGIDGTQVSGKTYDGNAVAQVTAGQLQGLVGNESLGVSASGVFDSKNAGTHGATVAYDLANGSGGGLADNYVLADGNAYQATIERKTLGIDGTRVAGKTYDGNAVAQVTVGQLQGLVVNESLSVSASGVFDSRNAGQRSASVAYTLDDGSGGGLAGNYLLADTTHDAIIDKAVLTLGAVTDSKTYDGSTASAAAVQVAGVVDGDRISGVSQSFDSRNAGTRNLQVDAGYAVDDGNGGNNYAVHIAGATGRIDPRALTITARDAGMVQGQAMVFDGTGFDTDAGLVAGESVRSVALTSEGSAADASLGRYVIAARDAQGSGGFEAGNYAIRYVDGQLEVTNPAADIPDYIAGATLCRSQPERRSVVPCSVQQRASVPADLPPQVPALTMAADFIRMP